ncbi:hypothetical protein DGG96_08345 [Legionella qingyii]|uniref:Uncharacterized protein n=1 Tax=Legionella qingyii TaxID=2184757 RepID=A0A317U260_9GAMM|nr:hypothetical protein DGG96_08345 [Legionella qingyii]
MVATILTGAKILDFGYFVPTSLYVVTHTTSHAMGNYWDFVIIYFGMFIYYSANKDIHSGQHLTSGEVGDIFDAVSVIFVFYNYYGGINEAG